MRFVIDDAFWDLFPEATIGIVVARGIDNRRGIDAAGRLLADAAAAVAAQPEPVEWASDPSVAPWRAAYRKFGAKPAKHRSSIETLLRSAHSGRLSSINPLVDLYNAVSLRHRLPCGGEDLAAIAGDLRLTRAAGGESFVPLGGADPQPPPPGEIVYRDDLGIVCRAWNWREAERTKLTPTTTDALLVIELIPPLDPHPLTAACTDLADLITYSLGGSGRVAILDRAQPNVNLAA